MTRKPALALALATAGALALPADAQARRMAMDPLNRVHAGLSFANDLSNPGVTLGLDSRLTRLGFVDVGSFFTPSAPPAAGYDEQAETSTWFELRHGIYVTPGLRVPHRSKDEGFNWDLIGRAGIAAIWAFDPSQTTTEGDPVHISEPALTVGADALLRWDRIGVRVSGKGYGFRTYHPVPNVVVGAVRPQFAVEAVYQW